MISFSFRHRFHLLLVPLYGWAFVMMRHDSEYSILFSGRFQMCLLSSVEFLRCVCLNDAVWFLYLVLKSFSVSPMYVSVV